VSSRTTQRNPFSKKQKNKQKKKNKTKKKKKRKIDYSCIRAGIREPTADRLSRSLQESL
jgi:hypothetical protein